MEILKLLLLKMVHEEIENNNCSEGIRFYKQVLYKGVCHTADYEYHELFCSTLDKKRVC